MRGSAQKPLVSIVIPVHNAEQYLNETLRTICGQWYKELEIICVNDGSNDRSGEILHKWEKKDPRIRILDQAHSGAGVARNTGMSVAGGKYLMFLDADDRFTKQMVRTLVRMAEKKDPEVIVFRYYKFSGRKKISAHFSAQKLGVPIGRVISPTDISDKLFQADHGMPWNKFYKTEFVRRSKVLFQDLRNTNDEFFSRITTVEAKSMMFIKNIFVGYRVGNGKSLQGSMDRSRLDFTKALAAIHDELIQRGYYDTYYETYQKLAFIMIRLKLETKGDAEAFRLLANEISRNTWKRCELADCFAEKRYRRVFRAIKKGHISGAAYEWEQIAKDESVSVAQKIKGWLKRKIRRILQ